MLIVGDTIRQIKPLQGFSNLDYRFLITEVSDEMVTFKNSLLGIGVMSWDSFYEYFEKVKDIDIPKRVFVRRSVSGRR